MDENKEEEMIDLEKFERELPEIKKRLGDLGWVKNTEVIRMMAAFEAAMVALREERERCAKKAENIHCLCRQYGYKNHRGTCEKFEGRIIANDIRGMK